MRIWTGIAAALLAVPTAALACSCMNTDNPVELRAFAADAAKDAVALVEAETLVTYEASGRAGESMRVIRTLAGQAAPNFRIAREHFPSSASCDILYEKGQRAVMILYPVASDATGEQVYRTSGLCTGLLLDKPAFRDEVARHIGSKSSTERG